MKGYKTSKDYKRLKELLDKGYNIPVLHHGSWISASLQGSWYYFGDFISFNKFSPSRPFEENCFTRCFEFIEPNEEE